MTPTDDPPVIARLTVYADGGRGVVELARSPACLPAELAAVLRRTADTIDAGAWPVDAVTVLGDYDPAAAVWATAP